MLGFISKQLHKALQEFRISKNQAYKLAKIAHYVIIESSYSTYKARTEKHTEIYQNEYEKFQKNNKKKKKFGTTTKLDQNQQIIRKKKRNNKEEIKEKKKQKLIKPDKGKKKRKQIQKNKVNKKQKGNTNIITDHNMIGKIT